MANEKVKSKLGLGEKIIYSDGDVFDFPDKSIVGTKSFYITSRGRVFAHDTGGIFGQEHVLEYRDQPIKAEIVLHGIQLTNLTSHSLSFKVILGFTEFFSLYEKLEKNKFSFPGLDLYTNEKESSPDPITDTSTSFTSGWFVQYKLFAQDNNTRMDDQIKTNSELHIARFSELHNLIVTGNYYFLQGVQVELLSEGRNRAIYEPNSSVRLTVTSQAKSVSVVVTITDDKSPFHMMSIPFTVTLSNTGDGSYYVIGTDNERWDRNTDMFKVLNANFSPSSTRFYSVNQEQDQQPSTLNVLVSIEYEDKLSAHHLVVTNNGLTLTTNEFENIPYYRISDYSVSDSVLTLMGVFNFSQKTISRISLFIPYEKLAREIIEKIDNSQSIFEIVGQTEHIYPAHSCLNLNQYDFNKEITLAFHKDKIFFVNEQENSVLKTIGISGHQFFYNELECQLLIKPYSENLKAILLTISSSYAIQYITDRWYNEKNSLIPAFGIFNGTLLDREYKNQGVLIAIDISFIYIFSEEDLTCSKPIPFSESKFLFDEEMGFLVFNEEIVLMKSIVLNELKKYIPDSSIVTKMELPIGYTEKLEPFFLVHTSHKIMFNQSPEIVVFSIENGMVIDITISKYGTYESIFSEVKITLNDKTTIIVNLENDFIKNLIYQTYRYSKEINLQQVSSEQLFLSYSRQVNDYLLYHYFGQLMALFEGLKEISQTETNKDIKNLKIINFLYYTIQAQKKHSDTVSIYLPSMLGQEENNILNQLRQPSLDQPYKNLQRSLLNTTGQINRSLNEIESSISAVSFALIPRVDYDSLTKKQMERGLWTAGGMAAIGVFFPPLLVGAALTSVNTYFSLKDAEEQKKIREQNENNRLDFYVEKIMDTFNHFIETLLPYYVSEVNSATFQTYKQIHIQFQPVMDSNETRNYLFNRITQFYTYKQLPIDESVLMTKKELIRYTNDSLYSANERLNLFILEVENSVPKSIKSSKLR